MELLDLPNDVLKEILEVFDPQRFEDSYTLQQVRLVSRFFNGIASPVLFRGLDTLSLGRCHEDVISRARHLPKSPAELLRSRFKNLRLTRNSLIPRSALRMSHFGRMSIEGDQGEFSRIVRGIVDVCKSHVHKLLLALPADAKFDTLFIGQHEDVELYKSGQVIEAITRPFVLDLWRDLAAHPTLDSVTRLEGVFYPGDLERYMMGRKADLEPHRISFLQGIRTFVVTFRTNAGGYAPGGAIRAIRADWLSLGSMIRRSQSVHSLTLRYLGGYQVFNPLFLPGGEDEPVYHVKELFLDFIHLSSNVPFQHTLGVFKGLRYVQLRFIELREEGSDEFWAEVFDAMRENLWSLVRIYFESLTYKEDGGYYIIHIEFDDGGVKKILRRPLYTGFQSDIDSLRELLDAVIERRKEEGLEEDSWMTRFCSQNGVLRFMDSDEDDPSANGDEEEDDDDDDGNSDGDMD